MQGIVDHYENQRDEEAIAEAEAAYNAIDATMMQIPLEFVPQVEKLIARRAG